MSRDQEIPGDFEVVAETDDRSWATPEASGPVQRINNERNVSEVKWKQASKKIEQPLEAELSNEDLWMLIRRFNKQVYHVKAVEGPPSDELDLNRAEEEQFPPQKLRATTERFYTSLFPPASDAGSNSDASGGETTMCDSLTNAPETHKGESAEQEATNLVNDIASVALESASGKYGYTVNNDDPAALPEPDSGGAAAITSDALIETTSVDDQTKKPMKKKISKATVQTMRILGDMTDIYERFSNLLSPTSPFPAFAPRLQLVAVLMSIGLMFLVISSHLIVKTGSFIIGLAFFGDPVFQHTVAFLNRVPTNAQLTLAFLRLSEINSTPLPPPPSSSHNEPLWPLCRKTPNNTSPAANDKQPGSPAPQTSPSKEEIKAARKRKWAKIFRFIGHTIAAAIKGHVAIDRAMSIAGSTSAKNLIGMLRKRDWALEPIGPLKFEAKFERKRGTVVIDSSQKQPMLYFTTSQSAKLDDLRLESQKKSTVLFQIPVTSIKELRKTEGLGWKGKLIVELTAGTKDSVDGLVISSAEPQQSYHLTGMRGRDLLFNRLVAMDAQFWESH
ncbi:hypothetical protein BBP40_011274 [Aspergillus hancockii]|nr:hypothetical protein BBP40_011274 [Aspergillus hancockii]